MYVAFAKSPCGSGRFRCVCLGFQAMVAANGGAIVHAPYLMHGKTSKIHHDGQGVFKGLPNPFSATRYHSLVADAKRLPDCFEVTAQTEDGLVMGIRHKDKNQEGVQFHPEAYLTEGGKTMIENLLKDGRTVSESCPLTS